MAIKKQVPLRDDEKLMSSIAPKNFLPWLKLGNKNNGFNNQQNIKPNTGSGNLSPSENTNNNLSSSKIESSSSSSGGGNTNTGKKAIKYVEANKNTQETKKENNTEEAGKELQSNLDNKKIWQINKKTDENINEGEESGEKDKKVFKDINDFKDKSLQNFPEEKNDPKANLGAKTQPYAPFLPNYEPAPENISQIGEAKEIGEVKEIGKKRGLKDIAKGVLDGMPMYYMNNPQILGKIAEGINNIPIGIYNEAKRYIDDNKGKETKGEKNIFEILRGESEHKPGFIERAGEIWRDAGKYTNEAIISRDKGEQSNLRTQLQIVGGGVLNGLSDLLGDAVITSLKTMTPDKQQEHIVETLKGLMNTEKGKDVQKLVEDYVWLMDHLKEAKPGEYRDLRASMGALKGISDLVPISVGGNIAKAPVKGLVDDAITVGAKAGATESSNVGKIGLGGILEEAGQKLGDKIVGAKETAKTPKEILRDLSDEWKGVLEKVKGEKVYASSDGLVNPKLKDIDSNKSPLLSEQVGINNGVNPNDGKLPKTKYSTEDKIRVNEELRERLLRGEGLNDEVMSRYKKGNKTHFLPRDPLRPITIPEEKMYVNNIENIVNKKTKEGVVGMIGSEFGSNLGIGKEVELVLTKDCYKKIISGHDWHGNFSPENMIININEWDIAYKNVDNKAGDIVLIKDLGDGHYLETYAGFEDGKYVVKSYYEVFSKDIVDNYSTRGELVADFRQKAKTHGYDEDGVNKGEDSNASKDGDNSGVEDSKSEENKAQGQDETGVNKSEDEQANKASDINNKEENLDNANQKGEQVEGEGEMGIEDGNVTNPVNTNTQANPNTQVTGNTQVNSNTQPGQSGNQAGNTNPQKPKTVNRNYGAPDANKAVDNVFLDNGLKSKGEIADNIKSIFYMFANDISTQTSELNKILNSLMPHGDNIVDEIKSIKIGKNPKLNYDASYHYIVEYIYKAFEANQATIKGKAGRHFKDYNDKLYKLKEEYADKAIAEIVRLQEKGINIQGIKVNKELDNSGNLMVVFEIDGVQCGFHGVDLSDLLMESPKIWGGKRNKTNPYNF